MGKSAWLGVADSFPVFAFASESQCRGCRPTDFRFAARAPRADFSFPRAHGTTLVRLDRGHAHSRTCASVGVKLPSATRDPFLWGHKPGICA